MSLEISRDKPSDYSTDRNGNEDNVTKIVTIEKGCL